MESQKSPNSQINPQKRAGGITLPPFRGDKFGDKSLDMTPKAKATKAKINQWDYIIKLKVVTPQRKPSRK